MSLTGLLELENLVPLGVVFLTDPPALNKDGDAPDGWRWLTFLYDLDCVYSGRIPGKKYSLSPILLDIRYLCERWHAKCTYKVFTASDGPQIGAVRIYAIPEDSFTACTESQLLRARTRRGKLELWHWNRYGSILRALLEVMDFSARAWQVSNIKDLARIMRDSEFYIFECLREYRPFTSKDIGAGSYIGSTLSPSNHIHRLIHGEPISRDTQTHIKDSESALLEVYDSIDILEESRERTRHMIETNPSLRRLVSTIQTNDISGIKSVLYNYQRESVTEMLVKELVPEKQLLPGWILLDLYGACIHVQSMVISKLAEDFASPRGGILAENMGLGKTCICLALVCATRGQMAKIPSHFGTLTRVTKKPASLAHLCALAVNRSYTSWKEYSDFLPSSCKRLLEENPAYFDVPELYYKRRRQSARLSKGVIATERLYLSSTTLIVVPNNLYYQWISEIKKHCYSGFLRVLYVPYHTKTVNSLYVFPSALEMLKYDVVLMGTSPFITEADNPDSPLRKIYWKRFIVDEGHTMSSKLTRLVLLASDLHVERRWLVSGTPTSGLTKLYVSDNAVLQQDHAIKRTFSAKDDLSRLGVILANFFKLDPWRKDPLMFTKTVVKPFLSHTYGSSESLELLLKGLLVRHLIKNVENDIVLPPLTHRAVFLEPSYHNKVSVNLFVAVLAANAVTSERSDEDYMFHPANKPSLKRLITNLQRSTFHWVGFSHADLEALVSICETAIERRNNLGLYYHSVEDRILLRKCIDTANVALGNKIWRLNSTLHEMSYFIEGLPKAYLKNFCVDYYKDNISVYPFMQLNSIQSFFFKNRFISDPEVLTLKLEEHSKSFWKGYWKNQDKKIKKLVKSNGTDEDLGMLNLDVLTTVDKKDYSDVPIEKPRKKRKIASVSDMSSAIDDAKKQDLPPMDPFLNARNAKIVGTLSSKLSYLAARLLDHHVSGTKSVIFYQFEDLAYYLVELLDLLGLNYILYSTSIPIQKRNSKLVEFDQHKGTGISLVMDLKLASHGLTIIGATRMYFINPVWKKATEAQAIKRCHRIGQTQSVHVETLILENTLEEEMYRLRQDSGSARKEIETDTSADVFEDDGMRVYFENHEFLDLETQQPEYSGFECELVSSEFENRYMVELQDTGVDSKDNNQVEQYVKEMKENKYSLLKPVGIVDQKSKSITWEVPLFTETALEKINEAKKLHRVLQDEDVINSTNNSGANKLGQGTLTKLRNAVKAHKKIRWAD